MYVDMIRKLNMPEADTRRLLGAQLRAPTVNLDN